MYYLKTGIITSLILSVLLIAGLGCAGSNVKIPTLPNEGAAPMGMSEPDSNSGNISQPKGSEIWGSYYMVIDETDMSVEVIENRTAEIHWDVTWIIDICPACVTAKVNNFDPNTRTFWIELYIINPTFKIGYDVRFVIDLDGTDEYDLLNPDNYTRLFDIQDEPNPFRAIAKGKNNRQVYPKENHVDNLVLYISEDHNPVNNIPFIIEVSYPTRCEEPYMMDNIVVDGEFPPGGGGSATVSLVAYDSQLDHGEIWLRTGGIFTVDDILMTPGAAVGEDGREYSTTFSNSLGGGSGLTPILIEAYTNDLADESYPLNDYARIFADPGGASAIAGDVFDALNTSPLTNIPASTTITVNNTSGGPDPLPFNITDGTYYVTVQAGNYAVDVINSNYHKQDTLYDVIVPPDSVVLVCFGMAPKWLGEGISTISGVCTDAQTDEPIQNVGLTLDGGPSVGGIIQSRVTDDRGHYCFYSVPTEQQDIYTVHAFHPDYIPQDYEDVLTAANKTTPQIDFYLGTSSAEPIWSEDFEPGSSNVGTKQDWFWDRVVSEGLPNPPENMTNYHGQHEVGDILWRVIDPSDPPILNTFYDNGICTLPPDDLTDGYMPEAYGGHRFMWYGEELDDTPGPPHSGSFIDEWGGGYGDGGNSTNGNNAGIARTGPIDLTGYDELTLTLQTWWEIEAVDPSMMFDAMDVLISTDMVSWDLLDRLNPLAEPVPDSGNAKKAYTSAGFDQAAVWSPQLFDLSSFGGNSEVYLRFDFDTRDSLYNGFRSWVVDEVEIWDYAID